MCKCCEEESAKEPKPLGSSGVDYVLQWVLGVKCDPETLRGWNQSTIGEHATHQQGLKNTFNSCSIIMLRCSRSTLHSAAYVSPLAATGGGGRVLTQLLACLIHSAAHTHVAED